MTLVEFVRSKVHCSYEEAYQFISDFKRYSNIQDGQCIVECHTDDFSDDFDMESITDDQYAKVANEYEERITCDSYSEEVEALKKVFGENYV